MKRNVSKILLYRQFFIHCMIRDCPNFANDVHHIIPLSKGGVDDYVNFICLCHIHHRKFKYHRHWEKNQELLLNHKFYSELSILGFTTDMPNEQFRSQIASRRVELRSSCPHSIPRQEPVREENKHQNIHNYGHKKLTTTKKWQPVRINLLKGIRLSKGLLKYCIWCSAKLRHNQKQFCGQKCMGDFNSYHHWSRYLRQEPLVLSYSQLKLFRNICQFDSGKLYHLISSKIPPNVIIDFLWIIEKYFPKIKTKVKIEYTKRENEAKQGIVGEVPDRLLIQGKWYEKVKEK